MHSKSRRFVAARPETRNGPPPTGATLGRWTKPQTPLIVEAEPRNLHEINLAELAAGSYFRIGGHLFMAVRVNLETTATPPRLPGDDPLRGIDEIDMRLVHAAWKGCDA